MSPPTWTPDETSDSSLWSKLQQLSKIAALSKMASSPSLVSGPSLPIMRIWAPGGQLGRGLGVLASRGISGKMEDVVLSSTHSGSCDVPAELSQLASLLASHFSVNQAGGIWDLSLTAFLELLRWTVGALWGPFSCAE